MPSFNLCWNFEVLWGQLEWPKTLKATAIFRNGFNFEQVWKEESFYPYWNPISCWVVRIFNILRKSLDSSQPFRASLTKAGVRRINPLLWKTDCPRSLRDFLSIKDLFGQMIWSHRYCCQEFQKKLRLMHLLLQRKKIHLEAAVPNFKGPQDSF